MQIASKVTMKTLVGGRPDIPAKDAKGDAAINWLGRIVGIATGVQHGESNFGPWTALRGNFAATRLKSDGTIATTDDGRPAYAVRSGKAFLPDVAINLVTPALDSGDKGASVQFGFDVGVERDDNAATGYVYVCRSLIEPAANDPLSLLMGQHLALPAPTDANANDAGKDGEKKK